MFSKKINTLFWFAFVALIVYSGVITWFLVIPRLKWEISIRLPVEYELDPEVDMEPVRIRNLADARKLRASLIDFLWDDGLPRRLPDRVDIGYADPRYQDLVGLHRIDRIEILTDGFSSVAYLFVPVKAHDLVVVYHEGHEGDFVHRKDFIAALVQAGFPVLAYAMPLMGMNNQPDYETHVHGQVQILSHNQFAILQHDGFHSTALFFEPIAVGLNYLQRLGHDHFAMTGFSGGGWTTALYAALDERIRLSFPVAGSLPIFLRYDEEDWGDWEQVSSRIYRLANYSEFYVLGAAGKGRYQLQIYNEHDSCCFKGYKTAAFAPSVEAAVRRLGAGSFEVWIDDSEPGHLVSEAAMERIIGLLNQALHEEGDVNDRVKLR